MSKPRPTLDELYEKSRLLTPVNETSEDLEADFIEFLENNLSDAKLFTAKSKLQDLIETKGVESYDEGFDAGKDDAQETYQLDTSVINECVNLLTEKNYLKNLTVKSVENKERMIEINKDLTKYFIDILRTHASEFTCRRLDSLDF